MELDTAIGNGRRFKLSPFTIRRLGYAGKIREYRAGRAVRYDPEEIFRWMQTQGAAGVGPNEPKEVARRNGGTTRRQGNQQ